MLYEKHERTLLYEELRGVEWQEGKHVRLAVLLYRYAVIVVCSSHGRQKAQFANGVFPYFEYMEIVNMRQDWYKQGNNVVPVLPDGRLLMVIEERPTNERYPERVSRVILDNGNSFDLGTMKSLEFPGGGIDPGEGITLGILRELGEETEVPDQKVTLYRRVHPIYMFGSDLASANFCSVAYLSELRFEKWVENDGGLRVVALSESEVEYNIETGAISSGQAAIHGWQFYKEVIAAKKNFMLMARLTNNGYLSIEEVSLRK
ncbi:MAG: NUDIX domain-containing protein [Patescibacteria group bacterium]|nr:NUDIX domain-containing protein [Patescibacteria group bacterium]MDE2015260.1 NUDIX domain-containing protein [Patescibacteria group bacterium]MDE2227066.1 NUDIX domain-containing protein [Patescibacteria group bacterium]